MWLIWFFTPNYESIQYLQERFETLAKSLERKNVYVGVVNCENDEDLCEREGAIFNPFVFYSDGGKTEKRYSGQFDADEFNAWAMALIPQTRTTIKVLTVGILFILSLIVAILF